MNVMDITAYPLHLTPISISPYFCIMKCFVHLFSTLCQIWEDVLGFENAEFYIKRWPELDGLCFKDVLISFPDAIPCGIKVAADGGKIIINPDDSYVLRDGDEVLVIAEDDDTYTPGPLPEVIFLF